jgi:hypothetical protein
MSPDRSHNGRDKNQKPKRKMKIQIRTTTDSLDPNATCTPEEAELSLRSYCAEIDREIAKTFPEAEVEHLNEDSCDNGIRVTGVPLNEERDEQAEIEDAIQRICEDVFETGNFWA